MNTLLRWARGRIAYLDAILIMAFVTNRSKINIMTARDDETLPEDEASRFKSYVEQRAAHRPLAYIREKCEFMGLDFEVNEYTLIPRPDTEIVVETALEIIKRTGVRNILEIGAGSGCIAVSLAVLCSGAPDITAADISAEAVETARRNAVRHGVSIRFIQSDLFDGVDPRAYDMIISNPPYIPHNEIDALPSSVKDYEPRSALDGGSDGLAFYRAITEKATDYIVYELGRDMAEKVKIILERRGFAEINIINDLAGRNRVISARKKAL
ncbi:MAG: peptide chain release factor N(5)-glutamine methyltransferase [Clostridiales bacterium]|jgi:release factor glutamine methyltransferase|nr:peptide chain release factor N(5)-glutamine methyltransferase [Clostridiales bacterium]